MKTMPETLLRAGQPETVLAASRRGLPRVESMAVRAGEETNKAGPVVRPPRRLGAMLRATTANDFSLEVCLVVGVVFRRGRGSAIFLLFQIWPST